VFADWVLAGKVLVGERLVDDDFVGRIQSLTEVKCTGRAGEECPSCRNTLDRPIV
jgi:hypothetical protein